MGITEKKSSNKKENRDKESPITDQPVSQTEDETMEAIGNIPTDIDFEKQQNVLFEGIEYDSGSEEEMQRYELARAEKEKGNHVRSEDLLKLSINDFPRYDGVKNDGKFISNLERFLSRFEKLSEMKGWKDSQKATVIDTSINHEDRKTQNFVSISTYAITNF